MNNRKLIFASGNLDKIKEVQSKMPSSIEIISMKQAGFNENIIEDGPTIEANAKLKADALYKHFGLDCFADDTGLIVGALDGAPGVFSARYAGDNCSYQDNVNKLLLELSDYSNRYAHFKTVVGLWWKGKYQQFEGKIEGTITTTASGKDGFGYDPIFQPTGFKETFAEMSLELKNSISHRAIAIQKLIDFIGQNSN